MATFRKRGPYQWQVQVRKKGYPPQCNTFDTRAAAEKWVRAVEYEMDQGIFVSRTEAESTTLRELLERYQGEITPSKKGAASEAARIRTFLKHPLAHRIVATIRGVDIARYRDERIKKVSPSSVKRELVSLRWEHIDLNHCTAHLPDTKNGGSRDVPLSSTAIRVLRSLPRSIHGQVFPGLTTEAVKRAYIRAVRRAGIEDLHFHDLRHEATTRFFELGLNIMEVASITGHKDLRMLRRYTHLKAEDLARKLG